MSGSVPWCEARRFWRSKSEPGSDGWHGDIGFGRRLQLGFHVYRHTGGRSNRWVFQPFLIFDRKQTSQ